MEEVAVKLSSPKYHIRITERTFFCKNESACRLPSSDVPALRIAESRQPLSINDCLINSSGFALRSDMPPKRMTNLASGLDASAAFCQNTMQIIHKNFWS